MLLTEVVPVLREGGIEVVHDLKIVIGEGLTDLVSCHLFANLELNPQGLRLLALDF